MRAGRRAYGRNPMDEMWRTRISTRELSPNGKGPVSATRRHRPIGSVFRSQTEATKGNVSDQIAEFSCGTSLVW